MRKRNTLKTDKKSGTETAIKKQKAIPKYTNTKSNIPGKRLCINISSVNIRKAKKKYWALVEKQATCMKWSFFVNEKNGQVELIIDLS